MLDLSFVKNSIVLNFLLGFRRELIVIALFSSLANLLMLSPSLYMLQVYDRIMISRSELTLYAISAIVIALYLILAFCEWLRGRLIVRMSVKMDQVLGDKIFRANFEQRFSGHAVLPGQAFSDLAQVRQWLTGAGIFAFFDLPWIPIYIVVVSLLHPILGLVSLLFTAILIFLAWLTSHLTTEISEASDDEEKDLNALIHTKLRNADVIEVHGMLTGLHKRWWLRQMHNMHIGLMANDYQSRMSSITKEVRQLMQSLALMVGALLVINGSIGVASMLVASVMMGRVTAPLDSIVAGWKGFINFKTSLARIDALLLEHPDQQHAVVQEDFRGSVSLKSVVLKVHNRIQPILNNINLNLEAGKSYVIIGHSGSGKTSLTKLILGLWPDFEGEVLLDGLPVQVWDREYLGPMIGYLPQEIELFRGSIAENIARLGKIDSEKVIEASQITGIHSMIQHLPNGYDTQIGEGGSFLSGGQRQRVALARAIYGLPKLIILDEPNANLDAEGDAALAATIQFLRDKGSTVFLITHRENVVGLADTVIRMKEGMVESVIKRTEPS